MRRLYVKMCQLDCTHTHTHTHTHTRTNERTHARMHGNTHSGYKCLHVICHPYILMLTICYSVFIHTLCMLHFNTKKSNQIKTNKQTHTHTHTHTNVHTQTHTYVRAHKAHFRNISIDCELFTNCMKYNGLRLCRLPLRVLIILSIVPMYLWLHYDSRFSTNIFLVNSER